VEEVSLIPNVVASNERVDLSLLLPTRLSEMWPRILSEVALVAMQGTVSGVRTAHRKQK